MELDFCVGTLDRFCWYITLETIAGLMGCRLFCLPSTVEKCPVSDVCIHPCPAGGPT